MFRSFSVVSALAVAATCVVVQTRAQASERTLPMRFELRQQAPAGSCAGQCQTWISATGAITADTPRDFTMFAHGRNLRGAVMALDSDGGSVLGAISLGREIRRLDLTPPSAASSITPDRAPPSRSFRRTPIVNPCASSCCSAACTASCRRKRA